jgi:methyl-accepting chemotaxis protein
MSKDEKLLAVLTGKCDEIEQHKEQIVKESKELNATLQNAVDLVNRGGGTQLVSAFGSIKSFFQSTVKIMGEISAKVAEINQTLGNVQNTMNQVRQSLRS